MSSDSTSASAIDPAQQGHEVAFFCHQCHRSFLSPTPRCTRCGGEFVECIADRFSPQLMIYDHGNTLITGDDHEDTDDNADGPEQREQREQENGPRPNTRQVLAQMLERGLRSHFESSRRQGVAEIGEEALQSTWTPFYGLTMSTMRIILGMLVTKILIMVGMIMRIRSPMNTGTVNKTIPMVNIPEQSEFQWDKMEKC